MQHQFTDQQRSGIGGLRTITTAVAMIASFSSASSIAAQAVPGFTVTGGSIYSAVGEGAASTETPTQQNAAPVAKNVSSYTTSGAPFLELQLPQGTTDGWASVKQNVTSWTQTSYSDSYTASANLTQTTSAANPSAPNYAWFAGTVSYDAGSSFVGQSLGLSVTVDGTYPTSTGGRPGSARPTMPVFSISFNNGNSFTTLSGNLSYASGLYAATASTLLTSGSFLLFADGPAAMTKYSLTLGKDWTAAAVQGATVIQTLSTTPIFAQPVPEPQQWAMLLSGLLIMGTVARRRIS